MGIGNLRERARAPTASGDAELRAQRLLRLHAAAPRRGLRPARRASATTRPTTCGACSRRGRSCGSTATTRPSSRALARAADGQGLRRGGAAPAGHDDVFATPDDARGRLRTRRARALPVDAARPGCGSTRSMGELARRLGRRAALYRGLRPEALALAALPRRRVREIAGTRAPLTVTSTVRDERYQRLLVRDNIEATREYSLHTTGYAFDIARALRESRTQARRVPVHARPPAVAQPDRLGARARRDPHHRLERGEDVIQ